MGAVYELKRFKNSESKDLNDALIIYSQNIEASLRTDTREILHWIDYYPTSFDDKFIVLGFYLNKKIIGYAQFAYFIEERLIFVDYVVIGAEFRGNNTFYQFVDEIKEFFKAENLQFDFILAEVGGFEGNEPGIQTKYLIRLLKLSGFGVLKTTYFHPRLGLNKYESEFQSVLMVFNSGEQKKIKKETFLLFLETIYFKHYQRWYDAFFPEKEKAAYSESLIKLLNKSKEILRKKDFIDINGYQNLFYYHNTPPSGNTGIKIAKLLAIIFLFVLFSVCFGLLHLFLKNKVGIETSAQAYIGIAAGFILVLVLMIRKESKSESITSIIQKAIDSFS